MDRVEILTIVNRCLDVLEISFEEFKNYTEDDLKRQWRKLAAKYHPDSHNSFSSLEKAQEVNEAKQTLDKLIKLRIITLKNTNSKNNNQNCSFTQLYQKLNILYQKVMVEKKNILDLNNFNTVSDALELTKEILNRIENSNNNNTSIYDYGILLNYIELFDFFYYNTLHISNGFANFNFNHSNHVKNNNSFDNLHRKISLVHKQLLYNEVKKILRSFDKLEIYDKEVVLNMKIIDNEIINLKWYLHLSTFNYELFDKRVKKLIESRQKK